MKNLKVGLLAVFTALGLAGCGECQHVDDNRDHKCDKCGVVMSQCEDKDPKDHKCDWCGAKLTEHTAAANSHNCSICGEKLSDCVDDNHDGKCDICGKDGIPVHHVDNGTGYCDCGQRITVVSVELDTSNAKKAFALGEEFDADGLVLTATMLDETTKEIGFETSEPDMTTVGDKIVTVTYDKLDGTEGTEEYTINVSYWTEDDLALFREVSYVSDTEATFPYFPGMTTYADDLGEYWAIVLEDATEEDLIDYSFALAEFSEVVTKEGYDVEYEMVSTDVPSGAADYFGVDPDTAFAFLLVPNVEIEPNFSLRWYSHDELLVGGMNENGDFVLSNFFVNAKFESTIGLPLEFDYYFNETGLTTGIIPGFQAFFDEDIGGSDWLNNPLINGFFPFPTIADTSDDAAVFTTNYTALDPFNEKIQSLDLALNFFMQMATSTERNEFIQDLLDRGFTKGEQVNYGTEEQPYMFDMLSIDNKFFGRWEVQVGEELSEGTTEVGYEFYVSMRAPEEVQTALRAYAELKLIPALNIKVEEVELTEDATSVTGVHTQESTDSAEDVLNNVVKALKKNLGYTATIEVSEYPAGSGTYIAELNDGSYKVEATATKSDGVVSITLVLTGYIPEDVSELSIFKDFFKGAFPEGGDPVADKDYFVGEDGSIVAPFVLGAMEDPMDTTAISNGFKLIASFVPAYMSQFEALGLYYTDSTRTAVYGDGSFRTADQLYTFEIDVRGVEGSLVATVSVHTTVPAGGPEAVAKEIAYTLYGNPAAYLELPEDPGTFYTYFEGALTGLKQTQLSLGNLQYALDYFEDLVIPSYFVYEGYGTTSSSLTYYYVSVDGSMTLEYVAYFELGDVVDEVQTYVISLEFYIYNTPAE